MKLYSIIIPTLIPKDQQALHSGYIQYLNYIGNMWFYLFHNTSFISTGVELFERLSTMGIAVNLVTYLVGTMHLPSSTSANIATDFMGTSFLLCLLGGFLADSFLGRYYTIAIFAVI